MSVKIRVLTSIRAPIVSCFNLARDIDMHNKTMSKSKERAVAGVTTGLIGPGEVVTWEATHFHIHWRMTSRITLFDPPGCFVDEMVKGPFASFRHEHLFHEQGDETLMTDSITLSTWKGPQRGLTDLIVKRYLRTLIAERGKLIKLEAERLDWKN